MAAAEAGPVCGCVQGHRPSLQLLTEAGGSICLMCFIKLLADSSAFLTHKLYAVSELRQALHDPLFSAEFLHHHRHFVVAPLSEALAVCRDDRSSDLAKAFMELILDLCRLNEVAALDPVPVLHDFVLHIVLQLGSSSGLTCTTGHSYTLHVLGLLLDNYCKYGNVMPDAVRNHRGFLINLIAGLKLPGDQLRGEILFLLYKLSSFEDGISEVLPFLPDLIDSALNALVKSESDELRTNCIALLNTLAQQSAISIRCQQISRYTEAVPEEENGFARAFADAIKGSLISSDSHVQVAALQLLCHMCPQGVALASDLQILIEEGIMDYIFEILRVCENIESIVAWSIRALSMLSGARDAFTQRFAIGLETVNRVLDCSVEIALCAVQPDILLLIGFGLTGCPGAISTMRAEHLLQTLTTILNQFASDNFSLLNEVFDLTCSALAALLKLPCTSCIQDVDLFIETAISSTFITVSAAGPAEFECQALKHAILLLSEAFAFSLKTHDLANFTLADVLIEVCETCLLPMFIKNFQFLEDEDTVLAALGAFLLMVDKPDLLGSTRLAESLATASWFSLSYELMARFPAQNMKDVLMMLLGNLICRLERNGLDEDVKAQFIQLPADPQDLLVLLALSSIHDPQLKLTQFAIITILYISQLYGDRLAEEVHILACLEQYLLMNSSALCEDSHLSSIIKRLLYIYVFTMEAVTSCSVPCSLEAENLLVSLIEHCQSDFISSKMPKNVFTWLLQKESLGNYMMAGMLKWFKTFALREQERCHNGATSTRGADNEVAASEDLSFFLVSLAEDNCCGVLFNHLLDEVLARQAEEDIKIVVDCYIRFVKLSALAANQLCICGIVSNVRSWLAIYSSRLPGVFGCLIELLYQLLCALSCDGALDEESWHLLASQFVYTLADKLNGFAGLAAEEEVLILLSLMTLILHKSVENMGFLTQASGAILSNKQLQEAVNLLLTKAGAQGSKISKLDLESSDGKLLSCTLAFHLLCLRCTTIMLKPTHQKMSSTQPYLEPLAEQHFSLCTLVLPKSYEQVEHLCRMLYFGPQFLKVLSSSCLAEAFYGLTHTGTSHAGTETADAHKGLRVLQSIVMVLQGSMFDSSLIVRRNCSFCLYSLITNANLHDREKKAVHGSSWHRFLVEEFVLALSTPGWACESVPGTIYVAIGLLKMSSPPKWANSVLSPFCISAIISSLTPKRLTVATVVLLKELQSKGCLEGKHMEALHKILQMSRKTVYGENCNVDDSSLQQHDQRHNACSSQCRQDSDAECLQSHNHVANLAVSYYLDPLTGVRQCDADLNRSTALVTLIDEFLQETNSVTQRHAQP